MDVEVRHARQGDVSRVTVDKDLLDTSPVLKSVDPRPDKGPVPVGRLGESRLV